MHRAQRRYTIKDILHFPPCFQTGAQRHNASNAISTPPTTVSFVFLSLHFHDGRYIYIPLSFNSIMFLNLRPTSILEKILTSGCFTWARVYACCVHKVSSVFMIPPTTTITTQLRERESFYIRNLYIANIRRFTLCKNFVGI